MIITSTSSNSISSFYKIGSNKRELIIGIIVETEVDIDIVNKLIEKLSDNNI